MSPEIPRPSDSIVNSLIKRSLAGKIEWDFSGMDDSTIDSPITGRVGKFEFVSSTARDEGCGLKAFGEDGKLHAEFSRREAVRLRGFLYKLALKNPGVIERRRQEAESDERFRENMRREEAENLQRLREIEHLLDENGE